MKVSKPHSKNHLIVLTLLFTSLGLQPTFAKSLIAMKKVYGEKADLPFSEKEYFQRLTSSDSATFIRDFENYFQFILSEEQHAAYEQLPLTIDKKAYIRQYWTASNPNPLFPENDWLLDFLQRIRFARQHYKGHNSAQIDDRGQCYIRYGKPQVRFEDFGGPKKRHDNRLKRYATYPNESWSYENIADDFVVHFVKDGPVFRKARTLIDFIHGRKPKAFEKGEQIFRWIWASMVIDRITVSPLFGRANMKLGTTPLTTIMMDNEDQVLFTRRHIPPSAHDPIQAKNALKFTSRYSQFKAPHGKTRILTSIISKLKKNLLKNRPKRSSSKTLQLVFSGMLRDQNFKPIIRSQTMHSFPVREAAKNKLRNAAGIVDLLALPGPAELTLQIEEKERKKVGYKRQAINVRNFNGDSLMISDISLHLLAEKKEWQTLLPIEIKKSIPLAPYPFDKIKKSKPPYIYFEVYNLQRTRPTEKVEISYTISAVPKEGIFGGKADGKGIASTTFSYNRAVSGNNLTELIQLDFRNVKKGKHLLQVTIRHPEHPETTASISQFIEITK